MAEKLNNQLAKHIKNINPYVPFIMSNSGYKTVLWEQEPTEPVATIPHLAVILIGSNSASQVYVNIKRKQCTRVGIASTVRKYPDTIDLQTILQCINELNNDKTVHGIMVQLPLPVNLKPYETEILDKISADKDVDGLSSPGFGKLLVEDWTLGCCTPKGIMRLLDMSNICLHGKHVVIINDSKIVGKPLAIMMLQRNATVTVCNRYTVDIRGICRLADVLVVGVGIPNFINDTYNLKSEVVIVDVGINKVDGNIVGDVSQYWYDKCGGYTPVPGGVGPMTVSMLLENTYNAFVNQTS